MSLSIRRLRLLAFSAADPCHNRAFASLTVGFTLITFVEYLGKRPLASGDVCWSLSGSSWYLGSFRFLLKSGSGQRHVGSWFFCPRNTFGPYSNICLAFSMMEKKNNEVATKPDMPEDYALGSVTDDDRKLLRKIDWKILPIMFLTYFLQMIDKISINVSIHDERQGYRQCANPDLNASMQMSWACRRTCTCTVTTFPGSQRPSLLPTLWRKSRKVLSCRDFPLRKSWASMSSAGGLFCAALLRCRTFLACWHFASSWV